MASGDGNDRDRAQRKDDDGRTLHAERPLLGSPDAQREDVPGMDRAAIRRIAGSRRGNPLNAGRCFADRPARRVTTAMTHIAIVERLDGKAVDWMEKVTDEQYH